MKKRVVSVLLTAAMTAAMVSGCKNQAETEEKPSEASETAEASGDASETTDGTVYKVAVVKQMDHASLDEIADAVCKELDTIASEEGVSIEYEVYSGQGDQSVLKQIGTQVISEKVNAIIPIATLAGQVMATCAEETQTPVVFAAISDPENA